jgi:hypothetical protein
MRKLIANVRVADGFKNQKTLRVFTNEEEGTVGYSLVGDSGTSFSLSNMQCGWRGPLLPDNTYEYDSNTSLLNRIVEAVNGGVYKVIEKKLFVN